MSAQKMTLEQAIDYAAEHLPFGAKILVAVERESGWVEAEGWGGNSREIDSADMSLSEQVLDCVQWCIDQEPKEQP